MLQRILICVIAGCLFAVACSPNAKPLARHRIVYGLTLEPSGFDPHIHQSSELGIVLRQVYDTLLYRDPVSRAFVSGLATAWSVSEDGLVYTFNLRQGVTFHDGTPFNAQAVAANLDRITNPETRSQKAVFMLGPYTRYEIVDDYTIRMILAEPYSPLLDSLSQVYLGIASPTAFGQYTPNTYQFHQVGTGPFTFEEYVPGDRIVIRRNPSYSWGPSFYQPASDTSVDEIEFRFFTDPPTRALALEGNQAQVMGELLPTDARALTGNSDIRLIPVSVPGQPVQFLINTKRFPTDSLAVRQALLFGTNRSAIVDTVYQGFSSVAWGPLSSTTLFYNSGVNGLYAYDAGQARALLSAAGYEDRNNDGYVDFNGTNLEIIVIVPPWGLVPEVAQLLQDQWRSIGIKAVLQPVPGFNALVEKVKTGEYHLVEFDTFGLDPAFLSRYFLSNGSNNWTGYASTDLDNLLLEATRQIDPNVRYNLYAQIQEIVMREALILPIREYRNLNSSSAGLENLTFDAYGWFPILNNTTVSER